MNLQTITKKKKLYKDYLSKERNNLVALLFLALNKDLSQTQTRKYLLDNFNADTNEKKQMLIKALNVSFQIRKQIPQALQENDFDKKEADMEFGVIPFKLKKSDIVFQLIHKNQVYGDFKKVENQLANDFEAVEKENTINEDLEKARKNKRVFFAISHHEDSAKDHINYQGKVYYDEDYKSYIKEKEIIIEIENIIRFYKMKSFQWLISKPVWMITRPNCRHYYKSISINEMAKHNSYMNIVENNDMSHTIGQKRTQTLKRSIREKIYREEDVNNIINQYKERKSFHIALKKTGIRSNLIDRAITKDNLLIRKWQEYLQKIKK